MCLALLLASAALLDAACPEEVLAVILSPLQGDFVPDDAPTLEYLLGVIVDGVEAEIELDGQKVAILAQATGQVTLAGLSLGVHAVSIHAVCGGRRLPGGSTVSFLHAHPLEDEHDAKDRLLSWARTEEYRERVVMMRDAMRVFAAAQAEAVADLRARLEALEREAASCTARGDRASM